MTQLKYNTLLLALLTIGTCACKHKKQQVNQPAGYDLSKPVKYDMPAELHEISGIAFPGTSDSLYAEEDEHGRIYFFKPGDKAAQYTELKHKGDFEDIALLKDKAILLESKGKFYVTPRNEIGKSETAKVQEFKNILPDGEFESLYANTKSDSIYVLCKHCDMDKTSKRSSGFILQLSADGQIHPAGNFQIMVKEIERRIGEDKIDFHPSAITQNSVSKNWYILSSVNKLLVVADAAWNVKEVYQLDAAMFPQPEGIAFDSQNNLWISNEGQDLKAANVLKFPYHAGK
jgi:hypothetical protein